MDCSHTCKEHCSVQTLLWILLARDSASRMPHRSWRSSIWNQCLLDALSCLVGDWALFPFPFGFSCMRVSSCYTIFPIWIVRKLMRNIAVPKLIFETNELIAPLVKPVFDSIDLFLAVFTFFRVLGVVDTSLLAAPRCSFSFFQKKDRYWPKVRDLPPYRFLSYYLESAHQHSLRHLFSSWQQWIILKKKALLLLVWKGLEM